MAIFRVHKNNDFAILPKLFLKEKSMSLKSKGLLAIMLSVPDDWDFSVAGLAALSKDGKDAIMSSLDELEEFGYVHIETYRNEKGQYVSDYDVYDDPNRKNRCGKSESGNPPQYNSIIKKVNDTPNNPTLFDNKDSVISPKGDRSKDIEERRAKFHESLRPYIQEYGEDMIIAFYNYWVEKNPKGTKMRFEMEKTFEISRRLSTWKRNEEERKFRRR